MNKDYLKKIIVFCFVLVPLLSSIISTFHLVDLYFLGNPSWVSYTIAVTIEVGAVASFLTLSILSKLNKYIVWSVFFLLFFMQIVGNVYFSYDWVTKQIASDPNWLTNFREMMEFFVYEIDVKTSKMILSLLIGVPIPLISVFLLKSTTDYLGDDQRIVSNVVTETKPLEVDYTPFIKEATETIVDKTTTEEKKPEVDQIHITETNDQARNQIHPART